MPDPKPEPKAGEPGYVDPALKTAEPKPGEPKPGEPKPKLDEPKPGDPLDQKIEGEGIPDKFKGKTVKEVMELTGVTEAELTKARTEITQWHKFGEEMELQTAAEKKKTEYDPLEHIDEETAKAVTTLTANQLAAQMAPITGAMDAFMLERVTQQRPDFGEVKERAMKIYREMPQAHKYHPDYGLDFAYRFAKAEKEGGPPPVGPAPVVMGPSNTGGEPGAVAGALTKGELYVAEKMGMTAEDYKKHKTEVSPTVEMEADTKPKEE